MTAPAHSQRPSNSLDQTPIRCAFNWSGGKDSAHALGRLLADPRYEVRTLVTTVYGPAQESTVHQLPRHLLRAQARAIALPLKLVQLDEPGLGDYAPKMQQVAEELRLDGIQAMAFGDLDHSGADAHRRTVFQPTGLEVVQPLSGLSSQDCAAEFVESLIEAITVVVDDRVLDRDHLAATLDERFISDLPAGCDPNGERGEYHSFVWNAPYFGEPVCFSAGICERICRRVGTTTGTATFGYWRQQLE